MIEKHWAETWKERKLLCASLECWNVFRACPQFGIQLWATLSLKKCQIFLCYLSYVCVCVYIYIYIYIYSHIYIHIYVSVCLYKYIFISMFMCRYVIYVYVYICMYVCIYVIYVYVYESVEYNYWCRIDWDSRKWDNKVSSFFSTLKAYCETRYQVSFQMWDAVTLHALLWIHALTIASALSVKCPLQGLNSNTRIY